MLTDTIAAIATPLGEGGIAVIRVSGDQAIVCVEPLFHTPGGRKLSDVQSHTVHYGHIVDPNSGERVDEVLVTVLRAPRSFTTEDTVEISCHGGIIPVRKVLELVLQNGARIAEPGEFTKRAYLNGRIDLSQAEAIIDMIRSKSDRAYSMAMKQADGVLSSRISAIRHTLIEVMAHIEVNIDYPEHDVEELTSHFIGSHCEKALGEIKDLLKTANQGKILREGITTAIVGKPNVGKSSLLNALANENRAIVTDIPGTTRDVIEEYVTLGGFPLKLLDTAGIRETQDLVEQIGVEKSRNALLDAELILLVLNYNELLHEDEWALIEQVKNKQTIVVINKFDLPNKLQVDELNQIFGEERLVYVSLINHSGLNELEKVLSHLFASGDIEGQDMTYVSNVRHIHLLNQTIASLQDAMNGVSNGMPIDMIQIDVRSAWETLGEIIGDQLSDSLIDQIFAQFCLGK